jgi:anti-sigma factor RsiW
MAELNEQERADLIAYLDGEADPETKRTLEARLARDPQARAEAASLNKTWELLDYLPRPTPSATFTSRTMERLSGSLSLPAGTRQRLWPSWVPGAAWAAAVVAALLVGSGVGRWQSAAYDARTRATLEEEAARHLPAIENQGLYANVDDLAFLRALEHPDLFGDDDADSETE